MLFKLLFTGEHDNWVKDNHYEIFPLTSSVALLSDGTNHVLFDTGSLAWQEKLITGLAENGLTPDDITHICLTHFHLDHTANCVLFKNAKLFASKSMIDHKTGRCTIFPDRDGMELPLGIEMIDTPGHTEDHVSYLFEVEGKKYCFAGDAIRQDLLDKGEAPHYYSVERKRMYQESVDKIFAAADIIIPGHFAVIDNSKN